MQMTLFSVSYPSSSERDVDKIFLACEHVYMTCDLRHLAQDLYKKIMPQCSGKAGEVSFLNVYTGCPCTQGTYLYF